MVRKFCRVQTESPQWRRVMFVAAVALVACGMFAQSSAATPTPSISYYEYGFNGQTKGLDRRLYKQGYTAGKTGIRKQVVILDFGAPRAIGTDYGQQLEGFRAPKITYDRILQSLESFANGYHNGRATVATGSVTMVWGTNNGRIPTSWSDQALADSAGGLVNHIHTLRSYLGSRGFVKEHAVGGMDIEEDQHIYRGHSLPIWNDYPITKKWVDGYRNATPNTFFLNYGSDEIGTYTTPQNGFGQWTVSSVTYVSRNDYTAACPQIYNSARISEWAGTEYWADNNGDGRPIFFFCTLAQGKKATGNYGAKEAWDNFFTGLSNVQGTDYVAPGRDYLASRATDIRCATEQFGLTYCGV